MKGRRPIAVALALLALTIPAAQAEADLIFLTSGRSLSVRSHRVEGDTMTLALRAGGTMTLPISAVARVAPDEVPYPEPGEAKVAASPAASSPPPGLESKPYAEIIAAVARAHGVDVELVHAVVEAESNYHARARSPKGARGLMQLMPDTARQYDVRDLYDPKSNLEAGVRHLKDLLSRFDLRLALAAYNAGEAVVRRHGGVPPFPETRSYVRRILQRVGS